MKPEFLLALEVKNHQNYQFKFIIICSCFLDGQPQWFAAALAAALTPIINELSGIKTELTDVKTELTNVKTEVANLKTEVIGLARKQADLMRTFAKVNLYNVH